MKLSLGLIILPLLIFCSGKLFSAPVSNLRVAPIDGIIRISWEVYAEYPAIFLVERSEDSIHFSPITQIHHFLSGDLPALYSADDEAALPLVTYFYRVSFQDEAGNQVVSEVVSGTSGNEELLLGEFFPNPSASGHVSIDCRALRPCLISLTVISSHAEELFSGSQSFEQGDHVMELNFPEIPPGIYYVRVAGDEWAVIRQFVVGY